MSEYEMAWFKAAGSRALRTMAQAAIPLIPIGVGLWQIDWWNILGIVLVEGVLSLLTSLTKGLPEVDV